MNIVIYKKSDLSLVGTVQPNLTFEKEVALNVIPNFGGEINDYDYIEIDELYFNLELVDDVVTVVPYVPETNEPVNELEVLGRQIVEMELKNLQLEFENQVLGQQVVDLDIRLMMGGL